MYLIMANQAEDSYVRCVFRAREVGYIAISQNDSRLSVQDRIQLYRNANGKDLIDPLKDIDVRDYENEYKVTH